MTSKKHEGGCSNVNLINSHGDHSSQDDEKFNNDLEVGPAKSKRSVGKEDPFGDETNSEVKYRTMAWWLASPSFRSMTRLIGPHRQAGMGTQVVLETVGVHVY